MSIVYSGCHRSRISTDSPLLPIHIPIYIIKVHIYIYLHTRTHTLNSRYMYHTHINIHTASGQPFMYICRGREVKLPASPGGNSLHSLHVYSICICMTYLEERLVVCGRARRYLNNVKLLLELGTVVVHVLDLDDNARRRGQRRTALVSHCHL